MGIAYFSRAGSSRIHPAGGNQRKSRWAEKKAIVFRSETRPPNQLLGPIELTKKEETDFDCTARNLPPQKTGQHVFQLLMGFASFLVFSFKTVFRFRPGNP